MSKSKPTGNDVDASVDHDIAGYLNSDPAKSFFLFAGAGSGKTRSLVLALQSLLKSRGPTLRLRGQQIAVITYTNAACDEIRGRLQHDPLINVSTIHSFMWELIRGLNQDMRVWLTQSLKEDILDLEAADRKGRGGKASEQRKRDIELKQNRLKGLSDIRQFIYSPTGNNREREALNHSEVIAIGAQFLTERPLMRQLLFGRFPIVLIDESQDTNKLLMEAVLKVQADHPGQLGLGLFGDTMQRIYSDGKIDLGVGLPNDWARPAKVMNHRCPKRIVELVNKVRQPVDGQEQWARDDAADGFVRLFLCSSGNPNREKLEDAIRQRMKTLTKDDRWSEAGQSKTLILEHHMAAKRMGFFELFEPLHSIDSFKTGLLDGSLPGLSLFGQQVWPLVEAARAGDKFGSMTILRQYSPLLDKKKLKESQDQLADLQRLRASVETLHAFIQEKPEATFADVLKIIAEEGIFDVPQIFRPYVASTNTAETGEEGSDASVDVDSSADLKRSALDGFLSAPFSQIRPYVEYVKGLAPFDTHQNVKGREFDRVMVVMDDEETRGFLFSYEKLFGAKAKTKTDLENESVGKETGIERTRRLFYVTCSRSKSSLALVAYSANPQAVQRHATSEGWFNDTEIELIS